MTDVYSLRQQLSPLIDQITQDVELIETSMCILKTKLEEIKSSI